MKEFIKRFRSPALWLSMGALIIYCVKMWGGIDISSEANGLLDVLLPVLVGFGIINNPTDLNAM